MKNKIIRTFTVTLAAVLCLTAFSTTAFAGGTDPNPEPLPETTEAPQEEEPTTGGMEPEGVPVTLEGNATLVDDFYGDKQLITVTTKAGNYFYILIDRANEDKETAVHFLNQVGRRRPASTVGGRQSRPGNLYLYDQVRGGSRQHELPGM